jgi:hypothetical protein
MIMADDDWNPGPEIDPETRRPKVLTPLRRPSAGGGPPVRDIGPSDVNLGGGSRMIGKAPTYRRGGTVVKAQGGGFMGSVAQGFQQGFGGDLPTKKDKKKTGSSGGSSPNAPAPPTNTAGADPTDAGNWAGDSGISASDPASGAAAGETYRRGGKIKAGSPSTHYCKGGKVISSRTF